VLKIRLMGTKNEIVWFERQLMRNPKIDVQDFSEMFQNKGTDRFYRAYVEVRKANVKKK